VFYLSLAISFVTGLLLMLQPEVMWKSCKNHQLEMESELYKFRTESGEYADVSPIAQVVET